MGLIDLLEEYSINLRKHSEGSHEVGYTMNAERTIDPFCLNAKKEYNCKPNKLSLKLNWIII